MKRKRAFTLIEVLVASTIIIVLMGIGVASFRAASQNSRDAKRKADMEAIRQAMVLRRSAMGEYSAGSFATVTGSTGVGLRNTTAPGPFLTGSQPLDPINSGSNVYVGTASTTAFCFCARLEGNKGNATNSTTPTAACGNVAWSTGATGTAYCVSNP